MTLTLHRDSPKGQRLASRRFDKVVDNTWLALDLGPVLPPGEYYLEISQPKGPIGWWSNTKDVLAGGQAYADGVAVPGDRTLRMHVSDDRIVRIREFFTFRKPQPDYFRGPRSPGEWGWLEVYPQHAFYRTPGIPEQITVGVAQNAIDGKLSVLSNPRSHGRSFHDGKQPSPDSQGFTGRNFAEQWDRALKIDPPFIFITGWNEWIAGRFDAAAPFHAAGPVTFVDPFNREYSRDVEPMKGGHGDHYYYQMVANIRRFKGVGPMPSVTVVAGARAPGTSTRPDETTSSQRR